MKPKKPLAPIGIREIALVAEYSFFQVMVEQILLPKSKRLAPFTKTQILSSLEDSYQGIVKAIKKMPEVK